MLNRVSVWLDERAPGAGAFAHALDWAAHLNLPLHGVIVGASVRRRVGPIREADVLDACAETCKRRRVSWEGSDWQGSDVLGVQDFLEDGGLCVYGQSLPAARKEELSSWSPRHRAAASLICADHWSPLSRVLVLNQRVNPNGSFLTVAARICQTFRAAPVVLTVARSEKEARSRQRLAQVSFAAQQLTADFDFVVGCDVCAAVALESQWRRCSHVFVERQAARSWWCRLRGEPLQRILDLPGGLTFFSYSDFGRCGDAPPHGRGVLEKRMEFPSPARKV